MPKILTVEGWIELEEFEENDIFMWHPMLVWCRKGQRARWSENEWSVSHKASGYRVADFSSREQAAGAAADLAEMGWWRLEKPGDIEAAAKSDPNFAKAVRKVLVSWNALFLMEGRA